MIAWLDARLVETLHVFAVTLAELLLGIAFLPASVRKTRLDELFREQQHTLFGRRILPFGEPEAGAYATVVRDARHAGFAISVVDGQIAATALACGLSVATCDRKPFQVAELHVIDPWAEA